MAPTLILIRHAQALHNVNHKSLQPKYFLPDPVLSKLGEQQCKQLHQQLAQHDPLTKDIELVVVSPMRRTLQTALIGLESVIGSGVKVVTDALWQENSDKPCDTGTLIQTISSEFPNFDFSTVDPVYPATTGIYAFTRSATLARGQACLASLYHRPEKVIAVVSHSGFLRTAISSRRFANADYRIFDFEEPKVEQQSGKVEYGLKEWERTAEKGGGMGWSPKGVAAVDERDFPPEMPVNGEATREVPV